MHLAIPHESMINAGFKHEVIHSRAKNGVVISYGCYSHPGKGVFNSYRVDSYLWDSNHWGHNRLLQKEAGLFDLPGAEVK